MCSIAGFIDARGRIRGLGFLKAALVAGEPRGPQSAGFVTPTLYVRRVGPPSQLARLLPTRIGRDVRDVCLVHTRQASHGAVTTANCHPIRLEDGGYLVHNGVVHTDPLPDYDYVTETDTERFGARLCREGLAAAVKATTGWAAIAYWRPGESVLLWRSGAPLHVAYGPGWVAWASTAAQLRRALVGGGMKHVPIRQFQEGAWVLLSEEGRVIGSGRLHMDAYRGADYAWLRLVTSGRLADRRVVLPLRKGGAS